MIPRYTRPEMRAIWTDENKLDLWLQIEMHASEALVKEGIVGMCPLLKIYGLVAGHMRSLPNFTNIHRARTHERVPAVLKAGQA